MIGDKNQAIIAQNKPVAIRKSQITTGTAFLLCVVMVLSLVMPITAYTQESESKVVRVGWYESQILLFARKCMRLSELLTARDFPGIRS